MEAVEDDLGAGGALPDRLEVAPGHIDRDRLQVADPGLCEGLEEPGESLGATPLGRPDDAPPVVIDDDGDVVMALSVTELVAADAAEAARRDGLSRSPTTHSMIRPTVRQEIRRSLVTVVFSVIWAGYAVISSKSRVKRLSWAAHGAASTWTPHLGHPTRRRAYPRKIKVAPSPRCRHRRRGRRPAPGAHSPQTPQHGFSRVGLTSTTRLLTVQSTAQMTSPLTPRSRRTKIVMRKFLPPS